MTQTAPRAAFIITAQLPAELATWATALRTAHFPPERNFLDAHVTLFHALPPSSESEVKRALADVAAQNSAVPAQIVGIMSLGRGTALKLSSPAMSQIRDELASRFHGLLTLQDQQSPRFHITIQNKVTTEAAKALQSELSPQFAARDFYFSGLSLHIYRGGPWEHVRSYSFRKS
ncbi:MAG: 2'-5' RNA ligase family protein [Pontixanthobacter sp.]